MKPRIVFLVMSAVHPVEVVRQLSRALAPQTVLVHHDFSQTPDFPLDEPNVTFVADPKRTGWGVWSFTEGVFHGMQCAVRDFDFDYLQLLSPTCLPIKPLQAFEDHVASRQSEANFSWLDLYREPDAMMSVGYRMFSPEHSLRHRILRRLFLLYYGASAERLDTAGIQLRVQPAGRAQGGLPWQARLAWRLTQAWAKPGSGRHIFDEHFRPCFGSAWFGAQRHVVKWLIDRVSQPDIQRHFPPLRIPEELIFPTLLKNSGFKGGPLNHCIVTFVGASPKWLDDEDFETLRRSRAFFARKFPLNHESPIRRRVLSELAATDRATLRGPSPHADGAGAAPILQPDQTA